MAITTPISSGTYINRPYTGTVVNPYPTPTTTIPDSSTVIPAPTGSIATSTTPVPGDQVSTVTGIDPAEVAAATFGKVIPIWVGGTLRLGCHIIYGPEVDSSSGATLVSFGVSFGLPTTPVARNLLELRLDGLRAWSSTGGSSYSFSFRFYSGDETQPADPLVIAAYPSAPVAHRGQCCVFIEDLNVADFGGKVPFVSALIEQTGHEDGRNLGDALETIAAFPYVNMPSTEFVTDGISEIVEAVIVAEKVSFLELINRYARLYLWDIVQTDKLKVIERGTVAPDLSLDFSTILASSGDTPPIIIQKAQQPDVPRELEYQWIDSDRDYEINSITVKRPREPVPVTAGAGKDTIALPSVHDIHSALAWTTLRKYKDELARETVSFTTTAFGYEIEPGDIISVDAGFKTYILRVLETLKGANWTNQIKAEPILRCALPISAAAPLDGIPCLTGAWSMSRRLLSTFGGSIYYVNTGGTITRITDQSGADRHFKGVAPWSPADLGSNISFWFKGDSLVGADGSNVSTWQDETINNRDATATGGSEPQLEVAELNGLNVVHATRANSDFMTVALGGGFGGAATAGSVIMVIRATSQAPAVTCGPPVAIGGQFLGTDRYPHTDGNIQSAFCSDTIKTIGDPGDLSQWHLACFTSAASDFNYYFNAALFFNTGTNTFNGAGAIQPQFFAMDTGTTIQYFDGYMAEIIGYAGIWTTDERQRLEGYLAWKWGIESVLPGGHPYQSAPP